MAERICQLADNRHPRDVDIVCTSCGWRPHSCRETGGEIKLLREGFGLGD